MTTRINHGLNAMAIKALATDLDGTLLPLPNSPQHLTDLCELHGLLQRHRVATLFVTGRHFASVLGLLQQSHLFAPEWIIANVGTEIYAPGYGHPTDAAATRSYRAVPEYSQNLDSIAGPPSFEQIRSKLARLGGLREQEPEKQGRHKLSYYCDARRVDEFTAEICDAIAEQDLPLGVVSSVDPFDGDGLIDILPRGVNKNYALEWWSRWQAITPEHIIYAGDSGNDLHAMQSGYVTIVVGNATAAIKTAASEFHRKEFGNLERIYLAQATATSGVLQGVRHFLAVSS